jgi:hypothetical protein
MSVHPPDLEGFESSSEKGRRPWRTDDSAWIFREDSIFENEA